MLRLEHICKNFTNGGSEVQILKDVNLHITRGEFVAIIGQSGSGKSTLMNIIGCLDNPSSGNYLIDGKDVSHYDADQKSALRSKKFGFIFQRYNLISTLNATENVALPAIYAGKNKKERSERAKKLLSDLELSERLQNLPNMLSGGQQQRVSIARALMNSGEVILADEPTGALDSKSGEMVMEILGKLHKQGYTIVIVTHDSNIAAHANRVIEIKDGRIIQDSVKRDEKFDFVKEEVRKNGRFASLRDDITESFKMSVSAIVSHKMRSLLTMLGIIIGIASVICVVALGNGSQEKILSSIRAIGTNTIEIMPGKTRGDRFSSRTRLHVDDSDFLGQQSFLDYSTPNTTSSATITYQNLDLNGYLKGGDVHSIDINGDTVEYGRNFSEDDIKHSASVVILNNNAKTTIFGNLDPNEILGKIIFFKKKPLEVIGILKKSSTESFDSDRVMMYAPYTTVFNKINGDRTVSSITVKVKDGVNSQLAEEQISQILTQKRGQTDFHMQNSDSVKQVVEQTTGTMKLLIGSIAFISLVVGGIGVMNIMLVSVTERTKEIGIRMAIGAKQANILQQFLIEATLICIIGGGLGIGFSYLLGTLFNHFSKDFSMIFSPASIILAIVASSAIGIVFGYLPAKRASQLNPIEALSQE